MFDYLIVGAGFAGCVLAERLATQLNKRILIIDKRNHIGGNAYDFYNNDGILVHKYGPHIFHTNNSEVWKYLSQFTEWHYYQHRVKAYVDGKTVPFPINVDTINILYGTRYTSENIREFFDKVKVNKNVENSEDVVISKVGIDLYEKFFKGYTKKQWGVFPSELSPEVTSRIPVRFNHDDRYFNDKYQGIPKLGYTKMFEKMLNYPQISILLNTDFSSVKHEIQYQNLIYTGCIDEFFEFKFGKLPYRSLHFEFITLDCEKYQEVGTVNYPNDYDFTRITEFKYLTGQKAIKTTIVQECSQSEGEPFYPIPNPRNKKVYQKYEHESKKLTNIYFVGRLGEYSYYNMDMVVLKALQLYMNLKYLNQ